jgi:hypothetical protein
MRAQRAHKALISSSSFLLPAIGALMTYYDFDPHHLPQKLLAAIGLALTSYAQTERMIQDAIAGCLGIDTEYGAAVTTHMAMPLRFSILKSIAEIRIDDLDALDELDELISKAEDAGNRRNAIAHHSWCHDPKTGEVFTVKETARSSYSMDLIPMTIDKVESDAEFIYEVGMEFMVFMRFNNIRPPIPPTRPRFHKTKPERKKRRDLLLKGKLVGRKNL